MRFTRAVPQEAIKSIANDIEANLQQGHNVVWLVSGGSAIAAQVQILRLLDLQSLRLLTILPVDERFGTCGHPNSNSAQMREAGFSSGEAQWYDILEGTSTMQQAADKLAELAESAFASAHVVIATLGLGSDAHTAGLLPHSPQISDTVSSVISFNWTDYARITMGIALLTRIDRAYVLAYGESKHEALNRLKKNTERVDDLPSKVLYEIPSVTVYNDFIESEE